MTTGTGGLARDRLSWDLTRLDLGPFFRHEGSEETERVLCGKSQALDSKTPYQKVGSPVGCVGFLFSFGKGVPPSPNPLKPNGCFRLKGFGNMFLHCLETVQFLLVRSAGWSTRMQMGFVGRGGYLGSESLILHTPPPPSPGIPHPAPEGFRVHPLELCRHW